MDNPNPLYTLHIVYEEAAHLIDDGRFIKFIGSDAKQVAEKLFNAEAAGALGVHFVVGDTEYNLRTDKYLYWSLTKSKQN